MALTITEVGRRRPDGDLFRRTFDITFDSSYATGGEALTPANLGFDVEVQSFSAEVVAGSAVRLVKFDRANNLLLAYAPGGAEVTAATDLSAVTVRCFAVGR